jgi:hypothetical protein
VNAPAVYLVRFWVKPGGEEKVLDWLDKGHLKDVVGQPGFLWARRYKLTQPDAEGWPCYAMIYGVESLAALEAYFTSAATKQYARERAELGLDALLKMDRNWGTLDAAVDA